MNLHFVGIRKPRVEGTHADYAKAHGWAIPAPFGTDLRFDIPDSRTWWWSYQLPSLKDGVDGWCNDEAERTYDEFLYVAATISWRTCVSQNRQWSINRALREECSIMVPRRGPATSIRPGPRSANSRERFSNWSMEGMPWISHDTGGFLSTPTPELYTRWIEEAVFVPVMRAHGTHDSPRWPGAFGDEPLADDEGH